MYSIRDWCTQSITVQPMYINALLEDVLAQADEETVHPTTVEIQTQPKILRTPANASGMQKQTFQLTSAVVACCRQLLTLRRI